MKGFTHEQPANNELRASRRASDLILIVFVIGLGLTLFTGLALATPTLLAAHKWGFDSFFMKPTHTAFSPDEKYRILVSSKIDLPVIDPLDPRATISVELKNVETSERINQVEFGVFDMCDLENPTNVEWSQEKVIVRKKYNQKDGEFEFALR